MTTVSCAVLFFSSHLWFLLWIIEFYTISRCFMRVPPPPQPLFLFSDSDDTFFLPILSQNCIFADTCIDLIPSYTFHLIREFRICIWTFFYQKRQGKRARERNMLQTMKTQKLCTRVIKSRKWKCISQFSQSDSYECRWKKHSQNRFGGEENSKSKTKNSKRKPQ